jgi:hypothetical protein
MPCERHHTAEQIISQLRVVEVELLRGKTEPEAGSPGQRPRHLRPRAASPGLSPPRPEDHAED